MSLQAWRGLALWCLTALMIAAGDVRAEDLVIPGSGNPEHLLKQMAKAFNARQSQHRVLVPPRQVRLEPCVMLVKACRRWAGSGGH